MRQSEDRHSLLFDAFRQVIFVKNVVPPLQMCFLWITPNVADAVCEMSLISHEAVKVIALPKVAGTTDQ